MSARRWHHNKTDWHRFKFSLVPCSLVPVPTFIWSVHGSDCLLRISSISVEYSCIVKEIYLARRRQDERQDRQGKNIMCAGCSIGCRCKIISQLHMHPQRLTTESGACRGFAGGKLYLNLSSCSKRLSSSSILHEKASLYQQITYLQNLYHYITKATNEQTRLTATSMRVSTRPHCFHFHHHFLSVSSTFSQAHQIHANTNTKSFLPSFHARQAA